LEKAAFIHQEIKGAFSRGTESTLICLKDRKGFLKDITTGKLLY